jgi:hypothetical protein
MSGRSDRAKFLGTGTESDRKPQREATDERLSDDDRDLTA